MPDFTTMLDGQPLFERIKAMPPDERAKRSPSSTIDSANSPPTNGSREQQAERKQLLERVRRTPSPTPSTS